MTHFYPWVPGLGEVNLSRHAQERAEREGISDQMIEDTLLRPVLRDTPDGHNCIWRDKNGIRLVIIPRPDPYTGRALVVTIFKIQEQLSAKRPA